MASRKRVILAFVVALAASLISCVLFLLAFSRFLRGGVMAGVALNLWAVLFSPGICLMSLAFSPGFTEKNFALTMGAGFIFNVMAWTGVLYGVGYFVARLRKRRRDVSAKPA